MTRYLVVGNPIVTLGQEATLPDGAVIVEDRRIVAVGPRAQLEEAGPFERVIGSPDHLVMPGFINCHLHSESSVGPGLFDLIFELNNVQMNSGSGQGTEEDLYNVTLYGLINAIKGGQTAAIDMYYGRPRLPDYGAEAALRAYEAIGFRVAFGLVSRDQNVYIHEEDERFLQRLPPEVAEEVRQSGIGYAWPLDETFALYERLVKRWDGRDERIRVILAPDWTPSCSDALYQRCRRLGDEYGTGITSHVLETRAEMMFNVEEYGKPAVRRLADLGVLGPDFSCAHFVWVTDEELQIFADSGAIASNNAGSNLRLSAGICRTRDIMESGGRIAFGTDSISFSDTDDFFQELRLACYLQRTPERFEPRRLDTERVLRAAGTNGARGVQFEGQVGTIAPGALADLLVLKRDRLFFPPGRYDRTPVLDVILDRASAADLESVLINGRLVLDEGRITLVDEAQVRERVAEAAPRLYRRTPAGERLWQLGNLVKPTVIDFYQRWYNLPIAPASMYNAKAAPREGPA